jgi:hypothetical protein
VIGAAIFIVYSFGLSWRKGVFLIVAGIGVLGLHIISDCLFLFVLNRKFNLSRELLLLDIRIGMSWLLISYALILAGIIILVRKTFQK